MKTTILLALNMVLFSHTMTGQFGPQQVISDTADGAFRAIPIDLDNDGYMDIISALKGDQKIVWYKNLDGQGNFDVERMIADNVIALLDMRLADIDTDGDMDIVYHSNLDLIAWLENMDGNGSFAEEQFIYQGNILPKYSIPADLDNDGDIDILSSFSSVSSTVSWFENMDGLGTFSEALDIGNIPWYISHPAIADLDNDGDLDIISSYEDAGPAKMIWYENDGIGNFDVEKEIYRFQYFSGWTEVVTIYPTDLNNDNQLDLLIETSHSELEDYIYWLESIDGQGNFGEPQLIDVKETSLGSLRTFDLDGDSDEDVLVSFFYDGNSISWYENLDGNGTFGPRKNVTTELDRPTDAAAIDINSDGIIDVVSSSSSDHTVAWYEGGILSISENQTQTFKLYPNPAKWEVYIDTPETIKEVTVMDYQGRKIKKFQNTDKLSLHFLKSGIYFLQITSNSTILETHQLIKE